MARSEAWSEVWSAAPGARGERGGERGEAHRVERLLLWLLLWLVLWQLLVPARLLRLVLLAGNEAWSVTWSVGRSGKGVPRTFSPFPSFGFRAFRKFFPAYASSVSVESWQR